MRIHKQNHSESIYINEVKTPTNPYKKYSEKATKQKLRL